MQETPTNGRKLILRPEAAQLPTAIPEDVHGYMHSYELEWLFHAAWITKAQGVKGDLLEIGSFQGLSACALAQAGHLTCVDTWDTVCGVVDSRDCFQIFNANLAKMSLTKNVTAIVGDSKKKLPEIQASGRKFRLIFVDGDHSYEGASSDIHWSWRMLSPGGLLVVDDYHGWPGVQKAMHEMPGTTISGGIGKMAYKAKDICS